MVGSASDKIRHTILGQECKWRCSETYDQLRKQMEKYSSIEIQISE